MKEKFVLSLPGRRIVKRIEGTGFPALSVVSQSGTDSSAALGIDIHQGLISRQTSGIN